MVRLLGMLWLCFTVATVHAKDLTGSLFPTYKLQNQNGDWVSNKNYEGHWVAYYFYPKDHTPGCSKETTNFAQQYEQMKKQGLEVVGVSLDSVESHLSFAKDYKVKFSLLADVDKALSSKLDMVRYLPWPHTRRETLLVDDKGNIVKHYESVDPDTHTQTLFDDYLAIKKSLQ
ncbi:peroxiredoxin [Pleionea sp. CnH1-48]|uniref:peroxiredoxin n=1 Tax=Pleionea sp. CnH1-48 TaxID=2954494 RepID=UPI0020974A47|nr:peroxiredoxin [Pleionea sp. CnH1-48]MCO7223691.1 peroxiredoxin [Pleionea sp. CnH1-48]